MTTSGSRVTLRSALALFPQFLDFLVGSRLVKSIAVEYLEQIA
jgi:hypothetical protein